MQVDSGIDDVGGPPFSVVSDKAIFPYEGMRIWTVGRRAMIDLEIYLGGWTTVEGIRAASHPKCQYEDYGGSGLVCDPMPSISNEPWYPDLLKLTRNFRFGLTELKRASVSKGLSALAEEYTPKTRKYRR